jgi:hypothetical protein
MQTVDTSNRFSKYNWCPHCKELWLTEWMTALATNTCPLCETAVLRPPYPPQMQGKEQSPVRVPRLAGVSRRARRRRGINDWLGAGKELIVLRRT